MKYPNRPDPYESPQPEINSVSASMSDIGVRPTCYIDMAALDMTSEGGTEYNPYTVNLPEYNVIYDAAANGGNVQIETEEECTYEPTQTWKIKEGTPYNEYMPYCEKDGYEFVGWNTDPDAHEELSEYLINSDTTLYAIFKKDVTAEFKSYDYMESYADTKTMYNNQSGISVTFPEIESLDGVNFIGWTSEQDSAVPQYQSGETVNLSESKVYYGICSREITMTYINTIVPDGGDIQTQKYTQYDNASSEGGLPVQVTMPSALPDETDMYFIGWRPQNDSELLLSPEETVDINEEITFLSERSETPPEQYKITYDYSTNGGSSSDKSEEMVRTGLKADLTALAVKNGYKFIGWNTDKDAHEALNEYIVRDNTTLYAIFVKDTDVRFYSKNGIIQRILQVQNYNNEKEAYIPESDIVEPDAYKGWIVLGWRIDKEADSEVINFRGTDNAVMIPDTTKDYYAVYSRDITLSYNTGNDKYSDWQEKQTQYFNSAGTLSDIEFTLSPIQSVTDADGFDVWAVGSKNGEKYKTGDKIKVSQDTSIYAVWKSDTVNEYKITYDAATNGGTVEGQNTTVRTVRESEDIINESADYAVKDGYEFIGWNTDKYAEEALTKYIVKGDAVLYAIYKKTVKAVFGQKEITAVIYNNIEAAYVTVPVLPLKEGWDADGWRNDTEALQGIYKAGTVKISGDTIFSPVYKRFVSLTYDTRINAVINNDTAVQYMNESGKIQEKKFVLAQPPERTGYSFDGWTLNNTKYNAGDTVTITDNTAVYAEWKEIQKPENSYTVIYNYSENGGSSAVKTSEVLKSGQKADLTNKAVK